MEYWAPNCRIVSCVPRAEVNRRYEWDRRSGVGARAATWCPEPELWMDGAVSVSVELRTR